MVTQVQDFTAELRNALRAEDVPHGAVPPVDDSARARAEYSTDASNYRVVPQVVVFPRHTDEVLAALQVARTHRVPITARGGGTSIAGNSVGPGMVIDFSRHLNKILDLDPHARTARVQPGVIMTSLQQAGAAHGLRFGPDPSSQARATFGGMIGNNACGPHALSFGRTADNTRSLLVADGTGRVFEAGAGPEALDQVPGLAALMTQYMALIRTEFGRFSRQVSGYSAEHLLPENGRDLAKFLVGSEGTLATVLEATVDLVEVPRDPVLLALGYPDMPSAADAVPAMLAHKPLAVEGLDAALVDVVRNHHGPAAVPDLPPGGGWLMVLVGGEDADSAMANARAVAADAGTEHTQVVPAGAEAQALWRIRADGAGLATRTAVGEPAWPGWEDAAVPPERLGTYLREFDALLKDYGASALPYGHFGDGCIHARIDLPLTDAQGPAIFRSFMLDAAALVASHGGSFSGEHGDGRARGELLPLMYSAEAIGMFAGIKALFDPEEHLNPGIIVKPAAVEADLRRPTARPLPLLPGSGFSFAHDGGDFTNAVHRCVGVAKCRADLPGSFMCPSYLATRNEKDSTRGRARVLQEMATGELYSDFSAPQVHEALDLCLSCKACSRDCPVGVDMAQYKSEVLHRTYRGKRRPISHYALGWLPRWARIITAVPPLTFLVNTALRVRPLAWLVQRGGGMDTRRSMPSFTTQRTSRWWRRRSNGAGGSGGSGARPAVKVWVDSFSEHMDGAGARATLTVLEQAGYRVETVGPGACCGLTYISTGQLDAARARLRRTMDVLGPIVASGVPVVGVEPSCTAALRSDLPDLFADDPRAHAIAKGVYTLSELLTAEAPLGPADWEPPSLTGREIIAQPHCHQHAVMGYEADRALLTRAGARVRTMNTCCGLAGNFGMEEGHYEVSVKVAEHELLPALGEAGPDAVFLADGFSCRTQAQDLAGIGGVHLAQLLARP
ncbi:MULTISPECIES: FAD-binding and (Fe-S)-binding domain-containing protein [unclassified Pseudactinotalea]|uniref:FAD-binding and (Fe-S)-binding domain-containing protein n=1 Tax=unclassified Pseudactinotalea TaxID=2649176 RepID=UPI003C7DC384